MRKVRKESCTLNQYSPQILRFLCAQKKYFPAREVIQKAPI